MCIYIDCSLTVSDSALRCTQHPADCVSQFVRPRKRKNFRPLPLQSFPARAPVPGSQNRPVRQGGRRALSDPSLLRGSGSHRPSVWSSGCLSEREGRAAVALGLAFQPPGFVMAQSYPLVVATVVSQLCPLPSPGKCIPSLQRSMCRR